MKRRDSTYVITEKGGMELGEGTGATKAMALLGLYRLAKHNGVCLAPDGKSLRFTGKGPFPPNVDGVRFERVA